MYCTITQITFQFSSTKFHVAYSPFSQQSPAAGAPFPIPCPFPGECPLQYNHKATSIDAHNRLFVSVMLRICMIILYIFDLFMIEFYCFHHIIIYLDVLRFLLYELLKCFLFFRQVVHYIYYMITLLLYWSGDSSGQGHGIGKGAPAAGLCWGKGEWAIGNWDWRIERGSGLDIMCICIYIYIY